MLLSALLLLSTLISSISATTLKTDSNGFQLIQRAPVTVNSTTALDIVPSNSLSRRGEGPFSGKATYFDPGLGACGTWSSASDYIVALNVAQYGDTSAISRYCFQTITISYGGKSTQAQIVDACPGCPYGGLDMSPGLFQFFAAESVGVFYMSWTAGGGAAPSPTTSYSIPVPTLPTSTWSPEPKSTYYPPTSTYTPPSSTYTPPSTSSSSTVYSSASSTSSANITSATPLPSSVLNSTLTLGNLTTLVNSTSTGLALLPLPTSGNSTTSANGLEANNNLAALSQIVLGLAGLVSNAAQVAASKQ